MALIVVDQCVWELLVESLEMREECLHIILSTQDEVLCPCHVDSVTVAHAVWGIIAEEAVGEALANLFVREGKLV